MEFEVAVGTEQIRVVGAEIPSCRTREKSQRLLEGHSDRTTWGVSSACLPASPSACGLASSDWLLRS